MQLGDTVRVRSSGQHAKIIEELGHGRYRVLYVPEPAGDALDASTPQDEDDAGGIYQEGDLEPLA